GRLGQQLQQGEFDTIRGPALDGPAEELFFLVVYVRHQQRIEQGDRMPYRALLGGRGDHDYFTELEQLLPQRPQSGRVDAVVVGQQDTHEPVLPQICKPGSSCCGPILASSSITRPASVT